MRRDDSPLMIMLSADEKHALSESAERAGLTLKEYVRRALAAFSPDAARNPQNQIVELLSSILDESAATRSVATEIVELLRERHR